jgi:Flp pilus assembly protein TadG
VIVLFALLIPVLFALGAVVLDVGNWYVHKRHLQTQVDAAAFAGAHEFWGCSSLFDPITANKSIKARALEYAGDTLRTPSTIDPLYTTTVRNQQVQEPNDVRIALNSATYWGAPDAPGTSLLDDTLDPDGNAATPGDPCTTRTLDVKATDHEAPNILNFLPLSPSPKSKARVEIRQIIEQSGMLPFAVPEVDPAAVGALFVNENTGVKYDYQDLCPGGGPDTALSYWTTCAGEEDVSIPNGSENTSVIILISKNDPDPDLSLPLPNVCTQSPGLIRCHAGSGPTSGANFIHGWADIPGAPGAPQIRDVSAFGIGCTDTSAPYFLANADCSVGVTAKIDYGVPGDPRRPPAAGGVDAVARLHASATCGGSGDPLDWQGTVGTESEWSGGSKMINFASGRNPLSISWISDDGPPGPASAGCFPLVAAPYAADDASGPLEYVDIQDFDVPPYPASVDGNSRNIGPGHSISVVVGLNKPLQVVDPLDPPFLLRFASKSGSLNQALDCDAGLPFVVEITDGCRTTYRVNYYDWSVPPDGTYEWEDLLCSAYPNPSDLPPATFEPPAGTNAPNCVSAKTGDVNAMRQGLFARFQTNPDPAADNGCWPNNWPAVAGDIPDWINNHGPSNDPRYVKLVITDITAFTGSGAENVPVKYIAGFYATGWDVGPAGGGNQTGCSSENDPHPRGLSASRDNGDFWGHFINIVVSSEDGTASDQLCNFDEIGTCIAVLVE